MYPGFIENRPQELCKMCGMCCRCVSIPIPYDELKQMQENGDEAAMDFLELFVPYDSFEAIPNVDKGTAENIINSLKFGTLPGDEEILPNITFYRCRYIKDDNLCGIYQNRKELCDRFPSTAWAVHPPGCGFTDWLAEQREDIKQKIRQQKENLTIAQKLFDEAITDEQKERINQTINNIKNTIEAYAKYGSADW